MLNKFLFVLAVYSACLSVVGNYVNVNVPDPYMDEIFHVPQAQKFCAGNYSEWDPKITTLPGLYLISVGIVTPLNTLTTVLTGEKPDLGSCSTVNLRSQNVVFGLLNFVLLYSLTYQLHGEKENFEDSLALLSSINISMLPVLFFFNFLYYTDTVSTTMVLLMYSLYLSDKFGLSSLAGLLSVLCRQTNIIWVFCVAGLAGGQILIEQIHLHQARTKHPPTLALTTFGQIKEVVTGTCRLLTNSPAEIAKIIGMIVTQCFGFIIVGISFLIFVKLNNGIVVGDRSAHTAVIHIPQILYFSIFSLGFSFPFMVHQAKPFLNFLHRNIVFIIITGVLLSLIIHYNTIAHPYLLADNRHYTFYIWRRFFMRHWILKFVLVPAYILAAFCIANSIQKCELMFCILFPVCVVLSLAPQALMEFRYYIIPYTLLRLQMKPSSLMNLLLEFIFLAGINVVTIYLFLYKPFSWDHEPEQVQRFMW